MEGTSPANQGNSSSRGQWLKTLPSKINAKVMEIAWKARQLGKEDPRRVYHSLKVGLALTLITIFYYFKPVYDYGENAMWAILTVVLVLEFSVGATLGKGLNRMFATLTGGALGIVTHRIATLSGKIGEPILISTFVFIMAAIATFMKFFPNLKARYEYGLTIFILTFSLVSVSGYRDDQVLEMAHERLSTIIIGCFISIFVCICIYPVWIGEDLHNSVANNIEKLGNYLEGFGDAYFKVLLDGELQSNTRRSFLQGYKSVLTSKSSEETMANLARWEPGHGRFRFRYPWKNYLKVGNLTRECAYKIEALNNYLNSKIQTPIETRSKIGELCPKISVESSKALKELASTMKKMTRERSADLHIASSKTAAEELKNLLKTSLWEEVELLQILPAASVAYLLLEIVECTQKIVAAVYELANEASFKHTNDTTLFHRGAVQPVDNNNVDASLETIITVA
ncbi:Aluminum-activated malate transporter [Corchorus capsularis]|uniref:Aluminum-activated malate transporter n=1 Tax=Corchorus capsularis TaxID=210143 RepID=A0A1R3JJM8_COCAP|nr:Aluminum-activated malate transporter [Corchorus capsularis]